MNKLAQLQGEIAGVNNNQGEVELTQEEIEADAKARAQRRREKREKLKAKLLKMRQEKQALEDQLNQGVGGQTLDEYVNNMAVTTPAAGAVVDNASVGGGIESQETAANHAKMEKKLKKKIKSLLTEIEDIKDDSRVEKNQLLETISEQSKDMKLYEQILHAVMNDKEFKNATERAQWSE